MLRDRVEQLEELATESCQQLATPQAHLKRLLGGRGLPMLNEGQSLLFDDAAASAVGTVEDSIAPGPQEIAELGTRMPRCPSGGGTEEPQGSPG